MLINLNVQVKVILTETGQDVYKKYRRQFSKFEETVPNELVLPLWEFAQIFGSEMFMGNTKVPFTVNNQIEILKG